MNSVALAPILIQSAGNYMTNFDVEKRVLELITFGDSNSLPGDLMILKDETGKEIMHLKAFMVAKWVEFYIENKE